MSIVESSPWTLNLMKEWWYEPFAAWVCRVCKNDSTREGKILSFLKLLPQLTMAQNSRIMPFATFVTITKVNLMVWTTHYSQVQGMVLVTVHISIFISLWWDELNFAAIYAANNRWEVCNILEDLDHLPYGIWPLDDFRTNLW